MNLKATTMNVVAAHLVGAPYAVRVGRNLCDFCNRHTASMSGVNTECGRWACGPCALDLDMLDDTPCFVCRDSIRDQEHLWSGTESTVCCKYCIVDSPLCNQCVPLLPSRLQALLFNMCVALAPLDWPVLVLLSVYEWCVPDFCSVGTLPPVLQWAIAAKAKQSAIACSSLQTKSN